MSDQVIGRVRVRVLPDTRLFAKDAKQKLEREEKRLPKLKVQAELDYRSLKTSALKGIRALNQELRSNDRYKVRFRAEIAEAGMKNAVKKAVRQLNALAKDEKVYVRAEALATKVEAELDKESLTAMNTALNAYIKRISPKRVYITPILTPKSIGVVNGQLDKLTSDREVNVSAKLGGDNKALNGALDTLMKLSGARLGIAIFKHFRDFFSNIDKKIPLIGSLTLAIFGLSGAMLSAVGNTFSLSRALAQIGPGAVALPGIFAGIGIGLAATVAVFKDFNKELPSVGKRLKDIQDSMSAEFWERARKPLANMADVLIPKFARGLDGVARALGNFFGNLANSFSKELGGGAISRMFADLSKSIRVMSRHTDSIASLVRIFGEAGAGRLPQLARWVGELTDRFAKFMAVAERTGKIDRWINTSIKRLKSLGNVLKNGSKLFAGLARAADAASPGDALTNLADALDRAQKVVNGSTFQRKLTGVLTAAHKMMENISKKSGPSFRKFWSVMADTLVDVLPQVGNIIGDLLDGLYTMLADRSVQDGMRKLVSGIERGVRKLEPIFEILADKSGAVMVLIGEMADTFGGTFAASVQTLTPLLTVFLKTITKIVDLIGKIPEPMLQAAIAIGAAHVALGKLNGLMGPSLASFGSMRTSIGGMGKDLGVLATTYMTAGATSQRETARAKAATDRLKSSLGGVANAARSASGGLGVLVLSLEATADKGSDTASILRRTLGGALMGLAYGGLIGAAVGALAGLASSFDKLQQKWADVLGVGDEWRESQVLAKEVAKRSADAVKNYAARVDTLKASLDAFNAGITGQTRIDALDQLEKQLPGITAEMKKLGISERTLANAALGNARAQKQVNEVYNSSDGAIKKFKFGQHEIEDALSAVTVSYREAAREARLNARLTQDFTALLGKVPKKVISKIEATGIDPTLKGVAKVAKQYNLLDKRQIKALIKATGIDVSVKDVQKVIAKLKETEKVKPNLKNYKDGVKGGVDGASKEGKVGGERLAKLLKDPLNQAKPNLTPFRTGLAGETAKAKVTANVGGKGVGGELVNGVVGATYAGSGPLSAAGRTIIANALAAMRREAKIKSPSRETASIGDDMIRGLLRGLGRHSSPLARSSAQIVRLLLNGLNGKEAKTLQKALNKLSGKLPKDADKAFKKRINGMRSDMLKLLNSWNSVTQQIAQKMSELRSAAEDFRVSVMEAVHALGDPTMIEVPEGQSVTFEAITKNMTDAIAKAKKWAAALADLKKFGLNDTTFTQLLTAGPEAALAAAEAIAAAGKAGVDALNEQQKELDKYAKDAGNIAYKQHYENGVHMAQGLLDGLRSKQAELEKQMSKLGKAMTKAIKKELGIKSPSRVMRKIGGYTGEGFVLGVTDTHRDAEKAITGLAAVRPRSLAVDRHLAPASQGSGSAAATEAPIHIDSITIPLEDLAQLRSLEEFMEMLRVRTRKG